MSHYLFVCTSFFRETEVAAFETRSRKSLTFRMAMETPHDPCMSAPFSWIGHY